MAHATRSDESQREVVRQSQKRRRIAEVARKTGGQSPVARSSGRTVTRTPLSSPDGARRAEIKRNQAFASAVGPNRKPTDPSLFKRSPGTDQVTSGRRPVTQPGAITRKFAAGAGGTRATGQSIEAQQDVVRQSQKTATITKAIAAQSAQSTLADAPPNSVSTGPDLAQERAAVESILKGKLHRLRVIGQGREGTPGERSGLASEVRGIKEHLANLGKATRAPIDTNDQFSPERIGKVENLRDQALSQLIGRRNEIRSKIEGVHAGGTQGALESGLGLDPNAARIHEGASPALRASAGAQVVGPDGTFPAVDQLRGLRGMEENITNQINDLLAKPIPTSSDFTKEQREATNVRIEAERGPAEDLVRKAIVQRKKEERIAELQQELERSALDAGIAQNDALAASGGLTPQDQLQSELVREQIDGVRRRRDIEEARRASGLKGIDEAVSGVERNNVAIQAAGIDPEKFVTRAKSVLSEVRKPFVSGIELTPLSLVGRTGIDPTGIASPLAVRNGVVTTQAANIAGAARTIREIETSILGPLERAAQTSPPAAAILAQDILLEFPEPGASGAFRASRLSVSSETEFANQLTAIYQRLLAIADAR